MQNVYLLGYMGSGKSTIGKSLARKLKISFIDLDKYIEQKHNLSINSIFATKGENEFRKIEREALIEVSMLENHVVSLGGGTPCFFDNIDIINNSGKSIYLKMSIGMLVSRLINAKTKRPLIEGKNKEELYRFIELQLEDRAVFYSKANIEYDVAHSDLGYLVEMVLREYTKE